MPRNAFHRVRNWQTPIATLIRSGGMGTGRGSHSGEASARIRCTLQDEAADSGGSEAGLAKTDPSHRCGRGAIAIRLDPRARVLVPATSPRITEICLVLLTQKARPVIYLIKLRRREPTATLHRWRAFYCAGGMVVAESAMIVSNLYARRWGGTACA